VFKGDVYPGSSRANGREPKSCFGLIFKYKYFQVKYENKLSLL
jgi:hypothetical protein